jgi:hypothetical protein
VNYSNRRTKSYIQSKIEKNSLSLKQSNLFFRAKTEFDSHTVVVKDWTGFLQGLDNSCIMLAPFCGEIECEDKIKKDSAR